MSMWSELGIESTNDVNIIKRAYAEKAKEYHPEEYPNEFQRLRSAYKSAMAYVKRNQNINMTSHVEPETTVAKEEINKTVQIDSALFGKISKWVEKYEQQNDDIQLNNSFDIDTSLFKEISKWTENIDNPDEKSDKKTETFEIDSELFKKISQWTFEQENFHDVETNPPQINPSLFTQISKWTEKQKKSPTPPEKSIHNIDTSVFDEVENWAEEDKKEKDKLISKYLRNLSIHFNSKYVKRKVWKKYFDDPVVQKLQHEYEFTRRFFNLVPRYYPISGILREYLEKWQALWISTPFDARFERLFTGSRKDADSQLRKSILFLVLGLFVVIGFNALHEPSSSKIAAQNSSSMMQFYMNQSIYMQQQADTTESLLNMLSSMQNITPSFSSQISSFLNYDHFPMTQENLDYMIFSDDRASTENEIIETVLKPYFEEIAKDGLSYKFVKRTAQCLGVTEEEYDLYIEQVTASEDHDFSDMWDFFDDPYEIQVGDETLQKWIDSKSDDSSSESASETYSSENTSTEYISE